MTLRKKIKSKFKLFLRKLGMLCKGPTGTSKRIRISKTVYPDDTIVEHGYITKVPENKDSFASELHVFNEIKNSVKKDNKK
jgi:hypothetical protein